MSVIKKSVLILCLFFFSLIIALSIYIYWFDMVIIVKHLQRDLHQQLVSILFAIKNEPIQMGGLILFSLLYGIIHAAGPGHGKFIITTYLATQTSQLKKKSYLNNIICIITSSGCYITRVYTIFCHK